MGPFCPSFPNLKNTLKWTNIAMEIQEIIYKNDGFSIS